MAAAVKPADLPVADRVRVREERLLSNNHYILKTTTFDYLRADGQWQTQHRETYDRGDGAVVLLYDPVRRTVILTRQFRYPAFAKGYRQLMVEAPAGLLDDADPETRIRAEAEEEAGVRVREVRFLFKAFMSPGSVTETLHFFAADYVRDDVVGPGGGVEGEGEDIDAFEIGFDEAYAQMEAGEIVDAKTILLLRWAREHVFPG
jgi:nudix-type nucleoside diphosphatase (YffH/AdpP family)